MQPFLTPRLLLITALCGTFVGSLPSVNAVSIASFNVQKFGETKADNEVVMGQLVEIMTKYDIVLVMEVVDSSGEAMEALMANLNETPEFVDMFDLKLSPRVGSSSYQEAYAYIYRKDVVSVKKSMLYPDEDGIFDREPYIVQFDAADQEFTIAGCHVSPDNVEKELNEMDNVYDYILDAFKTKNVLLMGDYNADCNYLTKDEFEKLDLNTRPEFTWLLPNDEDTTVSDSECAYDRFVCNDAFADGVSKAAVYRFDEDMELTQKEALEVSDHYPIRLDFS